MLKTTDGGSLHRQGPFSVTVLLTAMLLYGTAGSSAAWTAQTESDDGLRRTSWISGNNVYRLSFSSNLDPIQINKLHSWTINLETMDGQPITQAEIYVSGGMPTHDHGLPTSPLVTRELGDGNYLLEGMRFHMGGYWEVVVSILSAAGSDAVVIKLNI